MSEIILGIMTAFLSGGVIVAIVNHCLASRKEREARKSDFRGFLGRWLGRITRERDVSRAYSEWLEHLWGYYGKTYRDFEAAPVFRELCRELGSLNPDDIQKDAEEYRALISTKIQALIDLK